MSESKKTECVSLAPRNLAEAMQFGKMVASSSFAPQQYRGKPEDVVIAIQMGMELGLAPMQALQNIAVINGRPSLWGDAAMALVRSHPDCEDIIESYDAEAQMATCTVIRRGCQPCVRTFSADDAKRAKLWGKQGPWTQYPQRMLQQRARGFALRDSFPDALRGLVTREEAEDYHVRPEPVAPNTQKRVCDAAQLDQLPAPEIVDNSSLLAEIADCAIKDRLREIYRGNDDAAIKDACRARVEELDAWMARAAEESAQSQREAEPPHADDQDGMAQCKMALDDGGAS